VSLIEYCPQNYLSVENTILPSEVEIQSYF
jgi:hypothetical protein